MENKELNKATIRLFKGIYINPNKIRGFEDNSEYFSPIRDGFIFDRPLAKQYSKSELRVLTKLIKEECGITPEQLNKAFHRSWKKVAEASNEQLFLEQITHYITIYGFEALGIYDENTVYIPHERLNIPELKENIKLVLIKGYTQEELKEKAMKLLTSGIALKEKTIEDLMIVLDHVGISADEIYSIKNKEMKIKLYDRLHIIPKEPTEFLRYIVYKTTGSTLLIKNKDLINRIKERSGSGEDLFINYNEEYGLIPLATVFNRYKPIFLAFKHRNSNETVRKFINKIGKVSKTYHKPMKEDYFNTITARIKKGELFDKGKFDHELSKINVFRKIRLANTLKARLSNVESSFYRVRNGKAFAKESTPYNAEQKAKAKFIYEYILKDITKDSSLFGKKVYLPSNINYALPTSEKNFVGNIPSGSSVEVGEDMIVGVNWYNVGSNRIDLDLSLTKNGGKIGWDSSYRTGNKDVLFSGDITDAPNGATELYYLKDNQESVYTLNLNYYNYDSSVDVPFKIILAKEEPKQFNSNYVVNPNNVITTVKSEINKPQMVLGMIIPTEEGNTFYFTESSIGDSITAGVRTYENYAREALVNSVINIVTIREFLDAADVEYVDNPDEADINLDIDSLEKDTIINLITNENGK